MSLRRRLFLLMALILLVGVGAVGKDLLDSFRKASNEVAEAMMYEFARALAAQVETAGGVEKSKAQLAALFSAYQESRSMRGPEGALHVYVTDAHGIVVFSSKDPSEVGKDYSRWNDVYLALRGKYAARSTHRVANDPSTSMFYVAAPVRLKGTVNGVVSVIKSEESVAPFLQNALRRALPVGVLAVVLVTLFSVLVMVWITRPIHRLRDYALSVSEGRPSLVPEVGPRELRELTSAFEKMRVSLEGRKAIEDFVQGLVHELKSPLTSIQGAAELSLEGVSEEQRTKFLKNILREGVRLKSLLEELLRLARLEGLTGLENMSRLDLRQVLKDACEALEGTALQADMKIECSGDEAFVLGDSLLLEQSVRNLLSNALEFSPAGSVVKARVGTDGTSTRLTVSDEGPGVPEFARGRIFEKFYSLERPDGSARSSGLGLSFVKQVVQLHGGTVELGQPPRGAELIVKLPRA